MLFIDEIRYQTAAWEIAKIVRDAGLVKEFCHSEDFAQDLFDKTRRKRIYSILTRFDETYRYIVLSYASCFLEVRNG